MPMISRTLGYTLRIVCVSAKARSRSPSLGLTATTRLAQHGRHRGLILDADSHHVHTARNPRLDDLVLLRGIELGRAIPDEIDACLARGVLGALTATDEVR